LHQQRFGCYLNAIAEGQVVSGNENFKKELENMKEVKKLMKGVERKFSFRTNKRCKKALTEEELVEIEKFVWQELEENIISKNMCVLTAFLISLWTGLRSDNLVPKTDKSFDPRRQLTWGSLSWTNDEATGTLELHKTVKSSKKPVVFRIPKLNDRIGLCPWRAIQKIQQRMELSKEEMILMYKDKKGNRKRLTYGVYYHALSNLGIKLGKQATELTPHVPRITLTTLAARANISLESLKLLGNWTTLSSPEVYVRFTCRDIGKTQQKVLEVLSGTQSQ